MQKLSSIFTSPFIQGVFIGTKDTSYFFIHCNIYYTVYYINFFVWYLNESGHSNLVLSHIKLLKKQIRNRFRDFAAKFVISALEAVDSPGKCVSLAFAAIVAAASTTVVGDTLETKIR